ncbi:uncharacterized protein F4812DRAFT_464867 [Daldinia caldariorum]|uniref:uncharacterized protein n=1 Tax=Daldinia caldariorum TaxID=326644 RepID=UPI0020089901|nr:uncharacterized protein F4812DRAFT_464867 [Daldinia caldariorum]KAI1472825.1 hypothetical protein F4812DRAFT_464867 [Daldinia caldariorum]
MPPIRSTSDKRKEPWSASRSPRPNPEDTRRRYQADIIEELTQTYRNAPNGTRIGLHWNYVKGKKVAYIKDHFSGTIRPAIMKDDMYSNMSEKELEWFRQRYLRAKAKEEEEEEEAKEKATGGQKED